MYFRKIKEVNSVGLSAPTNSPTLMPLCTHTSTKTCTCICTTRRPNFPIAPRSQTCSPILKLVSPEPHGSPRGPEEEPMIGLFSYWLNIQQNFCILQLPTSLECDGCYFRSANEITRICLLAYAFTHGHYYDKLNKWKVSFPLTAEG